MYTDMQIKEPVEKQKEESDEKWGLQDLKASIKPKLVDLDAYDFVLSLKDPNYNNFFGIIGQDL